MSTEVSTPGIILLLLVRGEPLDFYGGVEVTFGRFFFFPAKLRMKFFFFCEAADEFFFLFAKLRMKNLFSPKSLLFRSFSIILGVYNKILFWLCG